MGWSEYRRSSSEELTCVVVSFQLEEAEWVGLSIEEALQKVQDIQDAKPVIPLKEYFKQDLLEHLQNHIGRQLRDIHHRFR